MPRAGRLLTDLLWMYSAGRTGQSSLDITPWIGIRQSDISLEPDTSLDPEDSRAGARRQAAAMSRLWTVPWR